MKSRHHSSGYIDYECQPWSADGKPLLLIDHNYVEKSVVDLDEFQGALWSEQRDGNSSNLLSGFLCALPFLNRHFQIQLSGPSTNRPIVWSWQSLQ